MTFICSRLCSWCCRRHADASARRAEPLRDSACATAAPAGKGRLAQLAIPQHGQQHPDTAGSTLAQLATPCLALLLAWLAPLSARPTGSTFASTPMFMHVCSRTLAPLLLHLCSCTLACAPLFTHLCSFIFACAPLLRHPGF